MSGIVEKIRGKLPRRYSHKNAEMNFDDADEADEETSDMVNKEYTSAENDDANPHGKPGSLINRMILHGNKKTDDQIASEYAQSQQARQGQVAGVQTATDTTEVPR